MDAVPATFAAGCYWGTERHFVKQFKDGLITHSVGFMGGSTATKPTYKSVCSGTTGHAEVSHLTYDHGKVAYKDLVLYFFRMHNPNRHVAKSQYRSAIFYHSEEQRKDAEAIIRMLNEGATEPSKLMKEAFGNDSIQTTLEPAAQFFDAHTEHQNYHEKNPKAQCSHRVCW